MYFKTNQNEMSMKWIKWSQKLSIAILITLFLSGCAGAADYTISLKNGFRIDRLSAHQIAIYGDEPIQSENSSIENYLYVPSKVTHLWWDENNIVAKQIQLITNENGVEQPPKKIAEDDVHYWIIDIHDHVVMGPLKEDEWKEKVNQLGIDDKLEFKSVEDLRE